MTSFQKWSGRGLDAHGRLGRLLLYRNLALEADLQCRWKRSDFFWAESYRQLRRLLCDSKVWIAAAEMAGGREDAAVVIKNAVVDELFIKTHRALQQAAAKLSREKPGPDEREFVYVRYLRDVFDAARTDANRQAEILVPLADRWIEAASEAKKWDVACAIARDMIARVPQERRYPEKLIVLESQRTTAGLPDGPLKARDSRRLKAGIERLEQLRKQYDWIPLAFNLIGRLRHLRAIALANDNQLSEALVESQKGMDFAPGDETAQKTDQRLVENMSALQARMAAVMQELRTAANKRLSTEGQKLANEAARGFTPVNDYIKSAERIRLQREVAASQSKGIWLDVGYAEPAADWDAAAGRLYAVLSEVLANAPASHVQLEHRVRQQIAPLGLEPGPATAFLARRLFPSEAAEPEGEKPVAPEVLPELKFESTKPVKGDEPFAFWLFSRQGMRLKIQTVLGLVCLLLALGLAGFDAIRRSQQDRAYRDLIAASSQSDYSHTLDASEQFLAHPALHRDDRTAQVKGLYSEALVRWFSLLPGTPDKAALSRVRRYHQLIGKVQ